MRDRVPELLVITGRKLARHPLEAVCRGALDAGFTAVMVREKDLEGGDLLDIAAPLHRICTEAGALFLVNDRVDVALALPGAGAHVGRAGLPVDAVRSLLGPDRVLGYSAHHAAGARSALDAGADYVTLSPIFPSHSKPGLPPRGVPFLRKSLRTLPPRRVVALGGIDAARIAEVRRAGAGGAAVLGAMMAAADPAAAAREIVRAWREAGGEHPESASGSG